MIDAIKERVTELLEKGEIKGFLGLAEQNGHYAPHLFQKGDDMSVMVLGRQGQGGRYQVSAQQVPD